MSGNLWELVNDWYGGCLSSLQTNSTVSMPGTYRVLRGGSWNVATGIMRSSYRSYFTPGYTNFNLGFRVARAP